MAGRRRLQLSYSSDEESLPEIEELHEEHEEPIQPPEPENFDSIPNVSDSIQISDSDGGEDFVDVSECLREDFVDVSECLREDFVDVSECLSPPADLNADSFSRLYSQNISPTSGEASNEASGCPISEFLSSLGLKLKREWLDACIHALESSIPNFTGLDVAAKAKMCFAQFLISDMNSAGAGILPENVHSMHLVNLRGPFVLQIDETVNISCPLRGRYQTAPSSLKRCLKLSLTDGVQRVFGMEYRPIRALEVLGPAGLKVVIRNVHIRHGLLLLVPESLEVLGGLVLELDAARLRLIEEVNKPARGRRTRNEGIPLLATRATRAAWPSNYINSNERVDTAVLESRTTSVQSNFVLPCTNTLERKSDEVSAPDAEEIAVLNPSSNSVAHVDEILIVSVPSDEENSLPNPSPTVVLTTEAVNMIVDDCPLVSSVNQEEPFTYLASLSAKWAATSKKSSSVQGKIKCFLTGVKGFQYKQRTTYELRVFVDDGSLISEILIDHNVVHKAVGHSPRDVTLALSSTDAKIVSDMKENLREFQVFLVNFEGMMLIEMNNTSPLPIALEMNQGCPESDAWMLLRRLESSRTSQRAAHPPLDPIDLSP